MSGYIKLHRQLLDSYQFSNPNNLKIWIWMLLKANYANKVVSIKVSKGYTDVLVERGQFVFGRHKAAVELDMDDNMIYRAIKKFENDKTITIKSNNQYSIITICKYDEYNKKDENDEQPVGSQRTANEQPVGTTKKDKKDKKGKEEFVAPSLDEVKDYFVAKGHRSDVGETAYKYYNENNWHDRNNEPVVNWKLKMISVWMKDETKITEVAKQSKMVW